jgi:hypothetical protein
MGLRILTLVIVFAIGILGIFAWNRHAAREAPGGDAGAAAPQDGSGMPTQVEPAAPADPGVEWQTPARWVEEPASGMRLATYAIPASSGAGEGARCAVYYFGPGQGGGRDDNIERWIGEFENPGKPSRRDFQVRGLEVAQVGVTGTYMAHAAPSDGAAGSAPGWMLLGAVVEGPHGALFFKLTGPAASAASAAKEFDALLASLRPRHP